MAFIVTDDLMKILPDEIQKIITSDGISGQDFQGMSVDQQHAIMGSEPSDLPGLEDKSGPEHDVEAPATAPGDLNPDEERQGKADDSLKLPKATRYGDDNEFSDTIHDDGHMDEMPESGKNKITDFGDASDRGKALLDAMDKAPEKKKGFKPKKALPRG